MITRVSRQHRIRSVTISLILLMLMISFIGLMSDAVVIAVRFQQLGSILPGIADVIAEEVDSGSNLNEASQVARRILEIQDTQFDRMDAEICEVISGRPAPSEPVNCAMSTGNAVRVTVSFRSSTIFLRLFNVSELSFQIQALSRRRLFALLESPLE